jgi:hypothetical protein
VVIAELRAQIGLTVCSKAAFTVNFNQISALRPHAMPNTPIDQLTEVTLMAKAIALPLEPTDQGDTDVDRSPLDDLSDAATLAKSHVKSYTTKKGTFVKEHDDKRQAKGDGHKGFLSKVKEHLFGSKKEVTNEQYEKFFAGAVNKIHQSDELMSHAKELAAQTGKPVKDILMMTAKNLTAEILEYNHYNVDDFIKKNPHLARTDK